MDGAEPRFAHGRGVGSSDPRIAQTSLYRDSVWSSYRLGRYALFERHEPGATPERRLYDVVADPAEQHDLASQRPAIVAEYSRGLRESLSDALEHGSRLRGVAVGDEALDSRVDLGERDLESLRALGYVE